MDRRERYSDPLEAVRAAQDGHQAQMWTALPGIIQSFDANALSATVQPAIKGSVKDKAGISSNVDLPLLVDVPVVFPHGGGMTLTFPLKQGDECLVVFASRCIDGWWQDGGSQPALDRRMHDLSDAFAIPGPFSQKRLIPAVSTTAAQLRSNDGATFVEVLDGKITVKATSVVIDTPTATFTGKIVAAGDVTAGTISLQQHVHLGVQSGSGISGVPRP